MRRKPTQKIFGTFWVIALLLYAFIIIVIKFQIILIIEYLSKKIDILKKKLSIVVLNFMKWKHKDKIFFNVDMLADNQFLTKT